MKVNSVYLVNSGSDFPLTQLNSRIFPPLGVVSIGTVVEVYRPDIDVRVFDGQVTPLDDIEKEIRQGRPDVVGISVLGDSYRNSLQAAKAAKESGAVTIFGNDQAAVLGRNMLRKREEIDYICTADVGEFAFLEFLDYLEGKKSVEQVPKLLYRDSGDIKFNDLPEMPNTGSRWEYFDSIPVPDRKLLSEREGKEYLKNYFNAYASLHHGEIKGVATINRARGCARYRNECGFCGIQDLSLRFSSPEVFWEDVRRAREDVNANFLYEAFDSMSSAPAWIKKLVDAKPKDLNDVGFFVYTQTLETNPRLMELYKRLGAYRVNIGFESGDDTMLKRMKGPRDSVETHKKASLLLRDAGIKIYGSLVPGAPGETQESLQRTIEFAKWLVNEKTVAAVESQPMWPEFNSRFGKWLMNPDLAMEAASREGFRIRNPKLLREMPAKYGDSDTPDTDEITRDWTSIFCEVEFEDLMKTCEAIRDYARAKKVAQGSAISPIMSRGNLKNV